MNKYLKPDPVFSLLKAFKELYISHRAKPKHPQKAYKALYPCLSTSVSMSPTPTYSQHPQTGCSWDKPAPLTPEHLPLLLLQIESNASIHGISSPVASILCLPLCSKTLPQHAFKWFHILYFHPPPIYPFPLSCINLLHGIYLFLKHYTNCSFCLLSIHAIPTLTCTREKVRFSYGDKNFLFCYYHDHIH